MRHTLTEKDVQLVRNFETYLGLAPEEDITVAHIDRLATIAAEMVSEAPQVEPTHDGVVGYLDLVAVKRGLNALYWKMRD
jgi:hypothetical protein